MKEKEKIKENFEEKSHTNLDNESRNEDENLMGDENLVSITENKDDNSGVKINSKGSFFERIVNFLQNRKDYCITFGIVLAIFLVHLIVNGVFTKGNTILISDSYEQVASFIDHFYNIFNGKATLFYSNFYGKGLEIFSTLEYMLLNPFYLIAFLGGRKLIVQMLSISMLCMLEFTALTFMWFSKKYFKNLDVKVRIFFVITYTFSAFLNFNYAFIAWYIYPALILLLIDKFIEFTKNGKVGSFIVIFTWYIVSCYSVGIATAIMLFIIFISYVLLTQDKDKKKKQLTGLFVVFAVSALISMAILFPAIIDVLRTGRGDSFISNLLSDSREFGIHKYAYMFADAGILILAVFYYFKCDKKDNFNKFLFTFTLLTFAPIVFDCVLKILCFSRYQGFPGRLYFLSEIALIIPAMLLIDKKMLKFNDCKTESISKLLFGFLVTMAMLVILILEFVNYKNIGGLTKAPTYLQNSIMLINLSFLVIFVVLVAFALFFNYRKILSGYLVKVSFAIVLVISLALNILTFTADAKSNLNIVKSDISRLLDKNKISGNFKIFNSEDSSSNSNFSYGDVRKISAFSSLVTSDMIDSYLSLGYNGSTAVLSDFTGTIISDTLMGVKYYVSDHVEERPYLKFIDKSEDYYLYENIFAGSGAYAFDASFNFEDGANLFENYDKLKNYFGISGELFYEAQVTIEDDAKESLERIGDDTIKKVTFTADRDGILYVNAYLAFDEFDEEKLIRDHAIAKVSDDFLQDLKYLKTGETYSFHIQKYFDLDSINFDNLKFKFLDYDVARQLCESIKNLSQEFKYTKNGYEVNLTLQSESNIIIFNPDLGGMNYKIDGKSVEEKITLSNMVSFSVSGSEKNVVAVYKYPYTFHWLIFALICIVLASIVLVLNKFGKLKALENVIYYAMVGVMTTLVVVIYGFGIICSVINFF